MTSPRRRGSIGGSRAVLIAVVVTLTLSLLSLGRAEGGSVCDPTRPATCTLRELAVRNGVRIGATAEAAETAEGDHATVLAREFDSVTPENAMKWYATQASPGTWTFGDADIIVAFAGAHEMEVRGHTLIWAQDSYTPAWVRAITDPAELQRAVEDQITTTMEHFGDSVHRWDVVNEPLATLGTGRSTSVFWRLGDDWIADAFSLARTLDPTAELWLNEYGSDWVPGKHDALLARVRELVDRGVPIDGVGLQTHRLPGDPVDVGDFAAQLADFTALGLKVAITELDVPVSPTDPTAFDGQAVEYHSITSACLAVPGCEEITVWGINDGSTWLDTLGVFPTPTRPLLFDDDFQPKPAYEAVRRALAEALLPPPAPVPTPGGPPTDGTEPLLPATGSSATPLAVVGLSLALIGLLMTAAAPRASTTRGSGGRRTRRTRPHRRPQSMSCGV